MTMTAHDLARRDPTWCASMIWWRAGTFDAASDLNLPVRLWFSPKTKSEDSRDHHVRLNLFGANRNGDDGLPVEDFPNLLGQRFKVKGLLQKSHAAFEHAVAEYAIVRITRNI